MENDDKKVEQKTWEHNVLPYFAQEILRYAVSVAKDRNGIERMAVLDRAIERVRFLYPGYFR